MKRIYLLGPALLLSLFLSGQRLEEFSADQGSFISELGSFMTSSKTVVMEEQYKAFEKTFKGGQFNETETGLIQQTMNKMLRHRLSANPHFRSYLDLLMTLKSTNQSPERFQTWHAIINNMLDNEADFSPQQLSDFLSFSVDFLNRQALRYSTLGTSWYARTDNYQLKYEGKEPVLDFPDLTLVAARNQDSIQITGTAGRFKPLSDTWEGKKGKVTWERQGLDADVYVDLGPFTFEMQKSLYEVPEAKLHYPLFFGSRVITGSFSDKLVSSSEAKDASYPRFESQEKILEIDNFGKGIKFRGGFKLLGTTIYGIGSREDKASLTLMDDANRPVFQGKAEQFAVKREDRIVAERVESVLYYGKDSIYHPSVNVRYIIPKREIQLTRGERGSDRNPFFSSVHNVNIKADNINVYLEGDSIVIGKPTVSIATKSDVFFESLHYFRKKDYERIQNIASANPLAIMKATVERENENPIKADLLAQRINKSFTVDNILSLLYDLAAQGFINYDEEKKEVTVKEKVFHYVKSNQGDSDYDVLNIRSSTQGVNAVMNMHDHSIAIEGIDNIEFSSRQKVAAIPLGHQILLREDRNIDLDGRLFAGFSHFEGKDFHFKYEDFQFQLDSVRYFDLYVPTGKLDDKNQPVALSIGSRIEHLAGTLLIDAPLNKSGREDIPTFPSLQTKGNSYVFYDKDSTQSGIYQRDSFYFRIDPFSFNRLDGFTAKDIQFKGNMVSHEIFPEFKETLVLRKEDQSLGFVHTTPDNGYPAYQGKGNYVGKLDLSNRGLLGQGALKYLGASINTEDIVFKPEEATGTAEKFNLEENRNPKEQIPQVRGEEISILWRPYKDSLYVTPKEKPFDMYKSGHHTFTGTLILTPGGLKGNGLLDWNEASMRSKQLAFGAFSVTADTTNLGIKAFDADDLALRTENVNADVDFDKQMGLFKANDKFLYTSLPYNQYITSMNEFTWDMKARSIAFNTEEGSMGTFTSIHPDQDSLRFQGKDAFYNLESSLLQISGIPNIVTADAFVYPDSGYVEIQKGGVMTQLENARIIADTSNKYHVINRATVNILGRRSYKASGFYEYNVGDRQQEVEFQNIVGMPGGKGKYSEKRSVTQAEGTVADTDTFYIDKKTRFQGTISLKAESKNLQFDGFALLDADKLPDPYWFTVSSEGDRKDLAIKFDTPKSPDGEPLASGIYLSKESSRIYPRAMQPLYFRKDRPILPVKGVFKYQADKDAFVFGDSSKVIRQELRGNQFVFKNADGTVQGEGKLELCESMKYVTVSAGGVISSAFPPPKPKEDPNMMSAEPEQENMMSAEPDTAAAKVPEIVEIPTTAEIMAGLQLNVPESLMKIISTDIKSSAFDARSISFLTDLDFYRKAASEVFPPSKEFQEGLLGLSSGYLDLPSKVNTFTLLFSKMKLKWDSDYQSFVSTDKNIGLISINGESINKMLTCYLEFKMPSIDNDDRLYVYVKSPSELFYFFGFKQGILSITSNNPAFMEALEGLKSKDKVIKMPDGETFEIQSVEPGTATAFIRRVEAAKK
ncbi:MAG TPA: hypothetical protein PKB07_05030 [Flavilitoribacter sp.]|nr:hypothetical protein [Flavilitoribacter sp.]